MSSNDFESLVPSKTGEPAWEALHFLPRQGNWHESDFLKLHTNKMAELVDGRLEILPMPTWMHQLIVRFVLRLLENFISQSGIGGVAMFAPLPVRLFAGTIREPDVLYVAKENLPSQSEQYPSKIDMAFEVVSEGAEARKRDHEDKPIDYAKAGVSEYWIIDPFIREVHVMTLESGQYKVVRKYADNEEAVSRYLNGFHINAADVFEIVDKHNNSR